MNGGWTDPYIDSINTNAGIGTGSLLLTTRFSIKPSSCYYYFFPVIIKYKKIFFKHAQ